jgi:hypothetical protein
MPGLYGFFGRPAEPASEMLARMADVSRQDPACREASAFASHGAIGAAERPSFPGMGEILTSRDGNRQVCMQGAIVGFLGENGPVDALAAARRCIVDRLDLEVLARARGSFAAVVLDSNRGTVELISDHNGTFPMSFAECDDCVLFGTQHKAILATGLLTPRLDEVGVAMMLQFGYLIGDTCLLEGVRQIPAATVVELGPEGVKLFRYRLQRYEADETTNYDAEVARLVEAFRIATHGTFAVSPRVGVPLSGGMDSRLLLALSPDPSRTPSFTFGNAGCRDLSCAADVARRLGSPHHKYITDPYYLRDYLRLGTWMVEGEMGATHYHILPYAGDWARHVDVVLDGIAGGHLLAGFYARPAWREAPNAEAVAEMVWEAATKKEAPDDVVARAGTPAVRADAFAAAKQQFLKMVVEAPGVRPPEKAMAFLQEHRTRRFAGGGARLLRWRVDVNMPGYDTIITDPGARIPTRWLHKDRLYLDMLQRGAPIAARARWQYTGLPMHWPFRLQRFGVAAQRGMEILVQKFGVRTCLPHRELHDLDVWLKRELRDLVADTLLSPRALERGILPADVQRQAVMDHLEDRRDVTNFIGVLLTLETFCRDFIDDFRGAAAYFSGPAQVLVEQGGRT